MGSGDRIEDFLAAAEDLRVKQLAQLDEMEAGLQPKLNAGDAGAKRSLAKIQAYRKKIGG
ncbi:hypothetical protein GQ85_06365 [Rhodococcus rhodochrous]|nr:hypothetical protein GQ85_06365 [Rhodococcus rhodochrous]